MTAQKSQKQNSMRWSQDGRAETKKILRQALKYQVKIGDKRTLERLSLGAVPKLGRAQYDVRYRSQGHMGMPTPGSSSALSRRWVQRVPKSLHTPLAQPENGAEL